MKEIQYKDFSLKTHEKNWRRNKPNVCQFELTFKCSLHCKHCYSDCYNNPSYIKKELNTKQVKYIIDKIHKIGVFWLCFTGGDPLEREDFLEIYSYAKDKGFLITIFTTGYSLTKEIADYLAKKAPFVIEITINGVTKNTYENIAQIEDSYERTMAGMDMMLKRRLPFKVKTMIIQENLKELPKIKEFLENKGLKFRPSALLHARLNKDSTPCTLRLTPEQFIELNKLFDVKSTEEDEEGAQVRNEHKRYKRASNKLFNCAAGVEDGINIDPYGKMFICSCIREPAIDLLGATQADIEEALFDTFPKIADSEFKTDSKCRYCDIRDFCYLCPGKSYLETGDMEGRIDYFCKLAHLTEKNISVLK